ncbi:MAG: hypothetical protein JWM34_2797 [Ilumatobacteraceae bacterium]|nr:hypothetical protein [Ilumatobacteraceae bacterium]
MSTATPSAANRVAELLAALGVHAVTDLSLLDRDGLKRELGLLGRGRSWLDSRHALVTRHLQRLAESQPSILPEADIAEAGHASRRDADQAARRAETLGAVPEMDEALATGAVSADHVDVLGRALKRVEDEDQRAALVADGERLAAIAGRTSPEQFDRRLRQEINRLDPSEGEERLRRQRRASRLRSWTDPDTGMIQIRGEFDPESGVLLLGRLESTVDAMFHGGVPDTCPDGEGRQDHLRALALIALVNGRAGVTDPTADTGTADTAGDDCAGADRQGDIITAGDRVEIVVVIDLETLLNSPSKRSCVDNGFNADLPIESYRRWACTAGIIPAVLDGDGVALDLGRTRRLATKHQRRALRAMYLWCAIPGCKVRSKHCEPHHLKFWDEDFGPTDLANLVPLCSRHHHCVHEGHWRLVMHPDRSLTITYPDGSIQTTGPPAEQWAA